jgi:hypothetical protein
MNDNENKIAYLIAAITDTQELIRFIDTKSAAVVSVLGAYIVGFFTTLEKTVKYWNQFPCVFWMFWVLFLASLILSITITVRIIRPTFNPTDNIKMDGESLPELPFFLGPNDYGNDSLWLMTNSSAYKLKQDYKSFKQSVSTSDSNKIVESLSFELLKISFIRNIKNDRFNRLLWFLLGVTITFFIFYISFLHHTQVIASALHNSK